MSEIINIEKNFTVRKRGNYLVAIEKKTGQHYATYNVMKDRFSGVCALFKLIRQSPKYEKLKQFRQSMLPIKMYIELENFFGVDDIEKLEDKIADLLKAEKYTGSVYCENTGNTTRIENERS